MSKKLLSEAQIRRFQSLASITPLQEMGGSYYKRDEEDKPMEGMYKEEEHGAMEAMHGDEEKKMEEGNYMEADEDMDMDMGDEPDMDMDMDDEQVEVEEDMVQDALRGLKDVQALLDALGGAEMDMDDAPADDMPMPDAPEEDEKELMEDDVIEESEIDLALEGVSYEASKDEIISEVAKRVARRIAEAKKAKAKYDRAIGNSSKK